MADETTDVRDHSILNVIARVRGKSYLIGVVKMDACNHSTFSQAIIKTVSEVGINFNQVVPETMLPTARKPSRMFCCLPKLALCAMYCSHCELGVWSFSPSLWFQAHIWPEGRKSRSFKFLADYIASSDVKLPPVSVSTRWEFMVQSSFVPCYQNPAIWRLL